VCYIICASSLYRPSPPSHGGTFFQNFPSLKTTYFSDHRVICWREINYPIPSSRISSKIPHILRKNLGEWDEREDKATVQLLIHPILLNLFHGRLTNMPELLLKGQIASEDHKFTREHLARRPRYQQVPQAVGFQESNFNRWVGGGPLQGG
jgi:hypothetical protein